MLTLVKLCMKALHIVGKLVGAIVKCIHHAVQVHKEKKAQAAAAQARAAQAKKAAAEKIKVAEGRKKTIITATGSVLGLLLVAGVVYLIYTSANNQKAAA